MSKYPIIDTLKSYSHEAEEVLFCLQKYDYRQEAAKWEDTDQPLPMELNHPSIQNLYYRLARHFVTIIDRDDNFDRSAQLTKANIEMFTNNLQVDSDTFTAATFTLIPIEPMLDVANEFKALNLINEYKHLLNIYNFAYGIRQWYRKSKYNPGTPIKIILELNYDEATQEERAADADFKSFSDLFKASCNYTTKQRRTLYNSIKALYSNTDTKKADKVLMAVILILRHYPPYKKPLRDMPIGKCTQLAFAAFGRDHKALPKYTDSSLTSAPKVGKFHVKTAETLISVAFSQTR